ncbi:MAG TPA: UDP-N-acetylglucosamine--N-acetylmuramyl-(pentapeptide) pyrophosphoryl-undecaprenol N-acetylglucosamine transferase [Caldisericia bacterium]|nr:UDP-N-acetylglucosamine--N-acetylmuramyl-(pentapeptide) pyrophosphoryl-undecaprenol N-acetylglucosamine transferase [Caldisericia bacterium]HPI83795.1 UDP-N-acetylglucosamine--N-acetylmuramyl-(pentapeptide) pyrophosphoryl-undecaprenol N-acetylglucosamine transferase [Caldisericia bacterium]HPQ92722.1 UDP-N-acetylglucosamine--N-acetylmuramyl-(pentapeptide) pyrophosphoryl-undecaprenol N-acetylglucosamine transferase [Caldisericia bacterium]
MESSKNVLICAGGTGGHVVPALTIAKRLIEDGYKPFIIGTGKDLEKTIATGIETRSVASCPPSANPIKALKFFRTLSVGIRQSKKLIKELKPVAVIGMGGYPSVPVVLTARGKVPILIHEANAIAGKANRFLERFADVVLVGFESTTGFKNQSRIEVVGNPLRWVDIPPFSQKAYELLGLDRSKKTILFFGGSQGANLLNDAFLSLPDKLITREDLQWLMISGKHLFEKMKDEVKSRGYQNVKVLDFLVAMDRAYSVANLTITRCGAMTISELECLGIPCVLIPKRPHIYDHQYLNAMYLKSKRECVILEQNELREKLAASIEFELQRKRMPTECSHMHAVDNISEILKSLIGAIG